MCQVPDKKYVDRPNEVLLPITYLYTLLTDGNLGTAHTGRHPCLPQITDQLQGKRTTDQVRKAERDEDWREVVIRLIVALKE
jgi:hypothetical protein